MILQSTFLDLLLPIIISVMASSGFWLWLDKKNQTRTLQTKLLIGLAHDRLITLGLIYITRGWITQDEYENFNVYLYKPYEDLGGNGSVKRLMLEVDKLPIRKEKFLDKITGDTLP
jgi:hypothetical protein